MGRKSKLQMVREVLIEAEVQDILQMFSALQQSYGRLPDTSGIDEYLITFDGFDGNNESEHLRAAQQIAACTRGPDVPNSHMPRLRGYQMMLQAWRSSCDKENLTKEEIVRIIRP